jgi:GNAT superfamily N-acetyltransferase
MRTDMRFLTYDELSPDQHVDRALLQLAAFGNALSPTGVERWRRRTRMFADYVGVFAVERGRLVGQTLVWRVPYTFPEGTEPVSGLAGVATRPDRGRAGVARAILNEVHRRERDAGIAFSTLWTNRSWGAHRLYEELGYRDVYAPPWVVHAPPVAVGRKPDGVRPARRSDLPELERLHARAAAERLGFRREPNGYFGVDVTNGDLDPARSMVVRTVRGRVDGYAYVDRNSHRTVCGELVAGSSGTLRALIAEVRRRAGGTPFAFQHTLVTDHPELFRDTGYLRVPTGWYVYMATALGRSWSPANAVDCFATRDRRFLCLAGDRF